MPDVVISRRRAAAARIILAILSVTAVATGIGIPSASAQADLARPQSATATTPAHHRPGAPFALPSLPASRQLRSAVPSAAARMPVTQLVTASKPARVALKRGTVVLSRAWQDALAAAACTATRPLAPKGSPLGAGLQTTLCRAYRLVFTHSMPARLRPGQVLVSGVSARLPYGMMAIVTDVHQRAAQTVVTAAATTPDHAAFYGGSGRTVQMAHQIMSEITSGRVRPSYVDPHSRLVPASQVPAATRAKLRTAVARSAATRSAAAGSCLPEMSLGELSGGLFIETQDAAIAIPKTSLSLYFSGWGYIAITGFSFTFNSNGYYAKASVTFTYDFTGYVYIGGQAMAWKPPASPSFFTPQSGTGLTIADFPLGAFDIQVGPLPVVIIPNFAIRLLFSGTFMIGATADFSSGTSSVTGTIGLNYAKHFTGGVSVSKLPKNACAGVNGPGVDPTQFGSLVGLKAAVELEPLLNATLWDAFGIGLAPTPFDELWVSAVTPFSGDCPNISFIDYFGLSLNAIANFGNNYFTLGNLALGAPIFQWVWGPFSFCGSPPVPAGAPVHPPGGPAAGLRPGTSFQLADQNSHHCVDIQDDTTATGAPAVIWPCKQVWDSKVAYQSFRFIRATNGAPAGYGWLQDNATGKQLTVLNMRTDPGAPVIQKDAPQSSNGWWRPASLGDGSYQFHNQHSGLCLDVAGGSSAPGTTLQQSTCHSPAKGTSQAFVPYPVFHAPAAFTVASVLVGWNQVVDQNSKECLDIQNDSTATGTPAVISFCKSATAASLPTQTFQFIPVSGGYGWLQDRYTGKQLTVLDVRTDPGAPVIQWDAPQGANGMWKPIQLSDGTYQFQNQHSGLCLDVTGAVTAPGTTLEQWTCHSPAEGTNQAFAVYPFGKVPAASAASYPKGWLQFADNNSNQCLDIHNMSLSDGAAVTIWPCKPASDGGLASQEFLFLPVSGSYGWLENRNSDEQVTVLNVRTDPGAPVIQWGAPQGANGLWKPIPLSNGSYQFQNQNSGLCLDVTGGSSTPDTGLQQWTCKPAAAGTNQAFAPYDPGHAPKGPVVTGLSSAWPWNCAELAGNPGYTCGNTLSGYPFVDGSTVTITGGGFGAGPGSSYLHLWYTDDNQSSCAGDGSTVNWGEPGNAASFTLYSWSSTQISFEMPTPSGPTRPDGESAWQVFGGGLACLAVVTPGGTSNTISFHGGGVTAFTDAPLGFPYGGPGLNLRDGPSTSNAILQTMPNDSEFEVGCQDPSGQSINGISTWYYVFAEITTNQYIPGWVWSGATDAWWNGIPICSNNPPDL